MRMTKRIGFMSQAEIAGGQVTPANELPGSGRQLRNFRLVSVLGSPVQLSDYRSRCNLVLVFMDDRRETAELLSEIAARGAEFSNEEAQILAIAQLAPEECSRTKHRLGFPYPLLLDEGGRVHREYGASNSQGRAAAAVYVTDRHQEVFGVYRTPDDQALPTATDILNWLEFINGQCPECGPPEWPL
jgi:peroxiredoxin